MHWKSTALIAEPPGMSPQVSFEGGAQGSQLTSVSRSVSFLSLSWALLSPFSLWRAPETSSGWEVSGLAEEEVWQEIQGAYGVDKGCWEGLLRPWFWGGGSCRDGSFLRSREPIGLGGSPFLETEASAEQPELGAPVQKQGAQGEDQRQPRQAQEDPDGRQAPVHREVMLAGIRAWQGRGTRSVPGV